MQAIFGFLLIIAIYVSYRVSANKGYSGILFAIGTILFPILVFVVFALPDKSQTVRRTEIHNEFDESIGEQQRKIDDRKKETCQPERETLERAEPKEETKPVYTTECGRTVNLKVNSDGELADTISLLQHAEECYREERYSLALGYFEKIGKTGHLRSQMLCGEMYYHGQGCDVNLEKALYWYEKAAVQGQPVAQNNCAVMYKEGYGCTANLEKALYWKEQLAEQGDADAQFETGMMYELGQGCTVDLEKARHWYEKAAVQGHTNAQKLLDGMK